MKKLYLLLLFTYCIQVGFTQTTLDSTKVLPDNPTSNDSIKIVLYMTRSAAPCNAWTNTFSQGGNNFDITDCLYIDPLGLGLPIICNAEDTVRLGKLTNGTYTYQVVLQQTGDTACLSSFMLDTSAVLSFTVGPNPNDIKEISLADINPKLYPNPATGEELIITYNNKVSVENTQLVIYSLVGNEVKRINLLSNTNKLKADIRSLTNGIYLYRLENEENLGKTSRIIVSR